MFAEFRRFSQTYVASALNIPGGGWNYFYWLKATDKERPPTAADWAFLAVGTFGAEYDQRLAGEAAQLWAFSTEIDFVEPFACLVEELKSLGEDGVRLVGQAASRTQRIQYGENLDFGQTLEGIGTFSDSQRVKELVSECLACYEKAAIGKSMPPPNGERLTGMTLWCPVEGDRADVGSYYGELEFERLSGWMSLLMTGARSASPEGEDYEMMGCWGLELVEARDVERTRIGEGRLSLAIPEVCRKFSGTLVEGDYRFFSAGSIRFGTYVALREFVRRLLELREGEEFEALRGCLESGWVIGGSVAGAMVADFEKYEARFEAESSLPDEALLYGQMMAAMKKVADDGVLLFF